MAAIALAPARPAGVGSHSACMRGPRLAARLGTLRRGPAARPSGLAPGHRLRLEDAGTSDTHGHRPRRPTEARRCRLRRLRVRVCLPVRRSALHCRLVCGRTWACLLQLPDRSAHDHVMAGSGPQSRSDGALMGSDTARSPRGDHRHQARRRFSGFAVTFSQAHPNVLFV